MPYTGQSGQYGSMPSNMLRAKYEVTSMGDNSYDMMREDMREGLRDMACSTTFFESDHKREDTGAEAFLALRHTGHRTGETPDAPDLFLGDLSRDPRGFRTGPDMQKIRDMAWDRKDSHKFYSDGDASVPERMKLPQVLAQQLRDQFELTKARLKWFSTSRDGFMTTAAVQKQGPRQDQTAQSGLTERDEIINAIKAQTKQAGDMQLGWEQTGDATLRIAHLGQVRGMATAGDVETNRIEAAATQRAVESTQQVLRTGAAALMRGVIDRLDVSSDHNAGTSQTVVGKMARLFSNVKPRGEEQIDDQKRQEAFTHVSRFIGQLNRQSGIGGQDIETQLQIVQFMDNAVAASRQSSEARFRAEDIVLSAKTVQGFADADNLGRGVPKIVDPLARRNVGETARWSASTQVATLGAARLRQGERRDHVGEGYKGQSTQTAQVRQRAPEMRAVHYDGTQAHATFATRDRSVRGLGSKFTRDKMDTSRELNAISSLS